MGWSAERREADPAERGALSHTLPAALRLESPRRFAMGGMAELFVADRPLPEGGRMRLVVKHMLPQYVSDPELVSRFRDEARLGLLLRHANIVRVLEYREIDGQHYMLMEQVEGTNLSRVIRACREQERQVPQEVVAYLMLGIASALAYMADATSHDGSPLGLVHRDISPSNVLVSREGVIKLIDFGVAKASTRETQTKAGVMVGKYAYMSPEQIRGKPVDIRADIFALGAVGYELLTGRRAFLSDTEFETYNLIVEGAYPRIETFRSDVDPILAFAIDRCLAVDLEQRYGHPLRLVEDLRLYLHDAAILPPPILAMQFLDSLDLSGAEATAVAAGERTAPAHRTPGRGGSAVAMIGPEDPTTSERSGPSYPSSPSLAEQGRGAAPPPAPEEVVVTPAPEEAVVTPTPTPVTRPDVPAPAEPRRRARPGRILGLLAALLLTGGVIVGGAWLVSTLRQASDRGDADAGIGAADVAATEPGEQAGAGRPEGAGEPAVDPEVIVIEDAAPVAVEEPASQAEAATSPPAEEVPPRPGSVSVYSIPWGLLTVDGREVGQTPVKDLSLSPGRHTLVVTNPDSGLSATHTVRVVSGRHEDVRLRIEAP